MQATQRHESARGLSPRAPPHNNSSERRDLIFNLSLILGDTALSTVDCRLLGCRYPNVA